MCWFPRKQISNMDEMKKELMRNLVEVFIR